MSPHGDLSLYPLDCHRGIVVPQHRFVAWWNARAMSTSLKAWLLGLFGLSVTYDNGWKVRGESVHDAIRRLPCYNPHTDWRFVNFSLQNARWLGWLPIFGSKRTPPGHDSIQTSANPMCHSGETRASVITSRSFGKHHKTIQTPTCAGRRIASRERPS